MGTTSQWQLAYPEPSDTPDVPRDVRELAIDSDAAMTRLDTALRSSLPDITALTARLAALESEHQKLANSVAGISIPDYTLTLNSLSSSVAALDTRIKALGMPAPVVKYNGDNAKTITATTGDDKAKIVGYDMQMKNPSTTRNLLVRVEMSPHVYIPRGEGVIAVASRPAFIAGTGLVGKGYHLARVEAALYGPTGNARIARYDTAYSFMDVVIAPQKTLTAYPLAWAYINSSATNKTPQIKWLRTMIVPLAWEKEAGTAFSVDDPTDDPMN